jgi:hypothetical protein
LDVFRGSTNFTSRPGVRLPPISLVEHFPISLYQACFAGETGSPRGPEPPRVPMAWFHAMIFDGLSPHFKHSSLFMITHPWPRRGLEGGETNHPPSSPEALDAAGGGGPGRGPAGRNHLSGAPPAGPGSPQGPQFGYERFNCIRNMNVAGRSFLWATHYCGAQATYPEVVARRAGTLPRRTRRRAEKSLPIWSCSVWGLPCPPHYCDGGALLPHLFTLT